MRPRSGSHAIRRIGLWCLWVGAVSLGIVLVTGFAGMAHKEVCLPQSNHRQADVFQNILTILYFASLAVLALTVVVGLITGSILLLRAVFNYAHT